MTQNVSYHIGKTHKHIRAPVHKRSTDSLRNDKSISITIIGIIMMMIMTVIMIILSNDDRISYRDDNDNIDDDNADYHDNTHVLYISIVMID